jgi:hypothetical protein
VPGVLAVPVGVDPAAAEVPPPVVAGVALGGDAELAHRRAQRRGVGGGGKDWWTLIGAVATAFVAGASAGRLAHNRYDLLRQGGQGQDAQGQQ